jgi:hypothetical protein
MTSCGRPVRYGECSIRLLIRRTVSSGRSCDRVKGLLISAALLPDTPVSCSRLHSSSLVKDDRSCELCIDDLFDPPFLRLNAGCGRVNIGSSTSEDDEPDGDSLRNIALGSGGRMDEAVIFRFGCRREAEGGWLAIGGGEVELSEGERTDRVWLFTDEPLLRCVETDGRRCQGGGGFSGSPDSCR